MAAAARGGNGSASAASTSNAGRSGATGRGRPRFAALPPPLARSKRPVADDDAAGLCVFPFETAASTPVPSLGRHIGTSSCGEGGGNSVPALTAAISAAAGSCAIISRKRARAAATEAFHSGGRS
eukprot:6213614-Pleurochrysis_carterae.AAC.1